MIQLDMFDQLDAETQYEDWYTMMQAFRAGRTAQHGLIVGASYLHDEVYGCPGLYFPCKNRSDAKAPRPTPSTNTGDVINEKLLDLFACSADVGDNRHVGDYMPFYEITARGKL